MDKKAVTLLQSTIIVMAVLLVFAVIMIIIQGKFLSSSGKTLGELSLQSSIELCKLKGLRQKVFADNDFGPRTGDSYPDSCDFCLGGDDRLDVLGPDGLAVNDLDGDNIPNACDNNPYVRADSKSMMKDICNGARLCTSKSCWKKETEQCELACFSPKNTGYPCRPDGWR